MGATTVAHLAEQRPDIFKRQIKHLHSHLQQHSTDGGWYKAVVHPCQSYAVHAGPASGGDDMRPKASATNVLFAHAEVARTAAPPFSTLSMPGLVGATVAGADNAYSL